MENTDSRLRRGPVGAALVRGAALIAGEAAVTVPKGERPATLLQNVVLTVMGAGAAAGFLYDHIAGVFHFDHLMQKISLIQYRVNTDIISIQNFFSRIFMR